MRNWFQNLGYRMANWMRGRYGQYGLDRLNKHLYIIAIVLILITSFWPNTVLSLIATFDVIYCLHRTLSRNIQRRYQELENYNRLLVAPKKAFQLQKMRMTQREYRFYRCECGTILRVPKGRGHIEVICPKCRRVSLHHS